MTLEDSTTYQLILNRGKTQGEALGEARGEVRGRTVEAQSLLLLLGTHRFGVAQPAVEAAVRAITDRERLERMATRLFTAANWDDVLTTA